MLIFVLDHHPLVSEMITALILRVQPQSQVVSAHTFKQLNTLIHKHDEPDFVFIEPQSTGCTGALSISMIAKALPNSKIIIIGDPQLDIAASTGMNHGAHQLIDKNSSIQEILLDLQKTIQAKNKTPDSKQKNLEILKISERHRQLIHFLDRGYSNHEISDHLGISEHTVKIHFNRLYKIINVKSRLEALNFARENGWVSNLH